jgi:hypothetical protein
MAAVAAHLLIGLHPAAVRLLEVGPILAEISCSELLRDTRIRWTVCSARTDRSWFSSISARMSN